MIRFLCSFCLVFLLSSSNGWAQTTLNPDRNEPLEITADDSLEWHRTKLYFKARKNVRAVQGGTTLISDMLTARYREGGEGMDIHTLQADGHVQIISAQSKAYGDHATYKVDKGYAVMTGQNLRLISDGQSVTARDKFQYWVNSGRLEAIGHAVAVRLGDKLEADKLIATFTEDKTGKRTLKTLEAIGHVVITTPTEILTGELAIYQAATNIAEIHNNVKIMRGPNVLQGDRAQVNLETNVSKIFGGTGENGRVRGVFYPGSETKPIIEAVPDSKKSAKE
ncbi:MAG: ostA-like family protein [Alphaproteobacteria bacterium]|nr:MAG: ostA-like family protein [Alphaproteobacteria bacterium]